MDGCSMHWFTLFARRIRPVEVSSNRKKYYRGGAEDAEKKG